MSKKVSAIVSCFNGQKYLPGFLLSVAKQSILKDLEIVLVCNSPTETEKRIVKEFQEKYPEVIKYIEVAREPLAVSTNRAIRAANGEYVCIWNIDDLRTEDSLEKMKETLDKNPSIGFTYGDFVIVRKWLSTEGRLIVCPEFEKTKFVRSMFLGPFYMWRKSLCEKIGYWDEQFKSGGDFDYASRLAVEGDGKKTQGLLGYYLDEGLGLSTGKTPFQPIERTVIELRFRVFNKLDFWYYFRAKKYNIDKILLDGQWHSLKEYMPNFEKYSQSKWWQIYAFFRYPFWIIKRVFVKLLN